MLIRPRVRTWLIVVLVIILLTTSGCWSRREMESLAYVLILGIDQTEGGNIKLIAQVGLPTQEPGAAGDAPVVNLLVSEGRDISEAIDNMFLQSTKRPSLEHLRLVIFRADLAKDGVWPVLDFLRRNIRIRLSTKISVTSDDIEQLLEVEDPLSGQPALGIIQHFNNNYQRSRIVDIALMDIVSELLEPDREAVLPIINSGEDRFTVGKTGVFKGDKMVATLNKEQTFGLLLWRNRVRSGLITMPQVGTSQFVSFRISSSRTVIKVRWEDDGLHVQVNVDSVLDIDEIHGHVANLENRANHYFINRLADALEVAQQEGTDFLGVSARLRRQNPRAWQAQRDNWEEVLRNAQYDLRSTVHVRRQGQIP